MMVPLDPTALVFSFRDQITSVVSWRNCCSSRPKAHRFLGFSEIFLR